MVAAWISNCPSVANVRERGGPCAGWLAGRGTSHDPLGRPPSSLGGDGRSYATMRPDMVPNFMLSFLDLIESELRRASKGLTSCHYLHNVGSGISSTMTRSRTQRTISPAWRPAISIAMPPFPSQPPNRRLRPMPTGFARRWRRSYISAPHWSVRGRTPGFIPSGWGKAGRSAAPGPAPRREPGPEAPASARERCE